jgi:TonB family protein
MKRPALFALAMALGFTFALQLPVLFAADERVAVVDRSTRNKVLNDYALLTRDSIQRSWRTPLELNAPSAVKGRLRINYTIDKKGNLVSVKLVQGSGNPEMDVSLMNAIRAAAPFPFFPDEIQADNVLVRANFIVANTPAVAVTRVSHPVSSREKKSASSKKFHWGAAAGAAKSNPKPKAEPNPAEMPEEISGGASGDIPPRFDSKKYNWGANKE